MSLKISIVMLLTLIAGSIKSQGIAADEQLLLQTEKRRIEAIVNGDSAFLDRLFADEFLGVSASASVWDKRAMMQVFRRLYGNGAFALDEMKVNIYGKVGVVTGKQTHRGKDGAVLSQLRILHLYLKRNELWQIVEGQATAIPQ